MSSTNTAHISNFADLQPGNHILKDLNNIVPFVDALEQSIHEARHARKG